MDNGSVGVYVAVGVATAAAEYTIKFAGGDVNVDACNYAEIDHYDGIVVVVRYTVADADGDGDT